MITNINEFRVFVENNSSDIIHEGDYIVVCKVLKCDDPNNKKGFTFNGTIGPNEWLNIYEKGVYGGTDCFRVRVHHHMGVNYEGSDKIVPVSEFTKQGVRATKYDDKLDWYVWQGQNNTIRE